jgi:hypothetical protein
MENNPKPVDLYVDVDVIVAEVTGMYRHRFPNVKRSAVTDKDGTMRLTGTLEDLTDVADVLERLSTSPGLTRQRVVANRALMAFIDAKIFPRSSPHYVKPAVARFLGQDVKVTEVTVLSMPYGTDKLMFVTTLPEACYPFTGKFTLHADCAHGHGREFIARYFPNISTTFIEGW